MQAYTTHSSLLFVYGLCEHYNGLHKGIGPILSRIYNCTKPGNRPTDNEQLFYNAHLDLQLHKL